MVKKGLFKMVIRVVKKGGWLKRACLRWLLAWLKRERLGLFLGA